MQRDAELLERTKLIYAKSCGSFGAPRVHAELRRLGECYISNALDDTVVESFSASSQVELLARQYQKTRRQLATAVFGYIKLFFKRSVFIKLWAISALQSSRRRMLSSRRLDRQVSICSLKL